MTLDPISLNPNTGAVVVQHLIQAIPRIPPGILPSITKYIKYHTNYRTAASNNHMSRLPLELQLRIFTYLNPVTSTCLGLTCKELWGIHKSRHNSVCLTEMSERCIQLHCFLQEWMGKYGLVYNYTLGEFISMQQYTKLGFI